MRLGFLGATLLLATLMAPVAAMHGQPSRNAARAELKKQVKVSEPFAEPLFQSLCHLWIERRWGGFYKTTWTGSAVLYRGRYLLTAGHNTYQDNTKIRSVEVRCGNADARKAPIDETIEPWQALDAPGYDGAYELDFGVIRLNRPIAVAEPFELATEPVRQGETIRFAGYPGGDHHGVRDGWNLNEARDATVITTRPSLAYYNIETFKSNSGGPVWREVGGRRELVAIHVKGEWIYPHGMLGGGRIVDDDYHREIRKLIAELDRRAAERGL